MRLLNVIVTGADDGAVGKFIHTLSEHVFVTPEQIAAGKSGKAFSIEFGRIKIDHDFFLYLAGLPSDESVHFIWERLADGLLGFVVIFDARTKNYSDETKELVGRLKGLTDSPFVLALDGATDKLQAAEIKKTLGIPREEQVVCCDLADRSSAKQVLVTLFNIGTKLLKKVSA